MSEPSPIRILIADDHAVVRAGLRSFLNRQPNLVVVGEVGTSAQMLDGVRQLKPDVVITDLRMPGGGVLETIRTLSVEIPEVRVVVFTGYDDVADAVSAFRVGAAGYVLKQAPESDLLAAIGRVRSGRRYVDDPLAARMMQEILDLPPLDQGTPTELLSDREAAVLALMARGYTGPEIAAELGVRVGTVESYRHRIRKKLGLRSRAEVTEFARRSTFKLPER